MDAAIAQVMAALAGMPPAQRRQQAARLMEMLQEAQEVPDEDPVATRADEARQRLADIRAHLLGHVGWRGMAPDEKIVYPEHGDMGNVNDQTACHVDSFLLDNDAVQELIEAEELAEYYCKDCSSRRIAPLTYISHSMSMAQLQFLFRDVLDRQLRHLLPAKSEEVTLMDIGSRLGAVLYAGYFMTDFGHLVGVEMEDYFCGLQRDVIKRFKLRPRVEVVCADVQHEVSRVRRANVVVMHNVFEFFGDLDSRRALWRTMRQALSTPEQILVTCPSLEESLSNCELLEELDLDTWVEPIEVEFPQALDEDSSDHHGSDDDDDDDEFVEEASSLHFYRVLG